jgi:hypothetical protein
MQRLLELTLNAINTQADNVARQAIAFWSAVCDVEYNMLITENEAEMAKCKKFILGAAGYLVPVLLTTMTQQVGICVCVCACWFDRT